MQSQLEEALEEALETIQEMEWDAVLLRMEVTNRGEQIALLRSQNELMKARLRELTVKQPKQIAALLKGKD